MKKIFLNILNVLFASMMLVGCDCCCNDPHIDIDYELVCSKDLLEYATPQVTYLANNATPVTFSISEGEWVEINNNNESVKSTIIINGDTITKDGKLMKWTRHIHYDSYSVVDDEMTVTYKPKENASGVIVFVDNFYHNLSANLEYVDDDGNKYKPTIISSKTNISFGIKQLPALINSYKDYYGFHVESNGKYSIKE